MNYSAVRKEDPIGEVLKHKVSYLCYQINNGKQKLFMKKLEAAHGFGFFAYVGKNERDFNELYVKRMLYP